MTETITACEDICRDFAWVAPLASILANFGTFIVGLGIIAAFLQLTAWRREAVSRHKAEAAKNCLVAVYNADDTLRHIRNPFDRIPVEEVSDRSAHYRRRYNRIVERNDVFTELRKAQIDTEVVIGNDSVSEALRRLFRIRQDVALAVEFLSDSENDTDPESRVLKRKWRGQMSGTYGPDDEFGQQQIQAVETVKSHLLRIARFEKN